MTTNDLSLEEARIAQKDLEISRLERELQISDLANVVLLQVTGGLTRKLYTYKVYGPWIVVISAAVGFALGLAF